MLGTRSLLLTVAAPAGIVVSLCAVITFEDVVAAFAAFAAATLTALGTAWLIARQAREACAQLRRRDCREGLKSDDSIYAGIVGEALSLIEQSESTALTISRTATQLEARDHIRKGLIKCFERVLNTLDDAVVVVNSDGECVYRNPVAGRLLVCEAGEAVDLGAITELDQLMRECVWRKNAPKQRTAEFASDVGGKARSYRATAQRMENEEGNGGGVVLVATDVTGEQLARTRHAEFVSSVSHELKTPMSGIKAFVEMLLDGEVESAEEQRELYGFIDMQVDRLTQLVNDILNLARIESGVIKVHREDLELNETLGAALELLVPVAQEKNIRIVPELSNLYLAVHADADLLARAVINLLSNAVKYTPAGGEVRLRSRMEEDVAVIEVKDTGMGIPAEALPHIFERFYRVAENNKAAAGTGLGLALVHYIVTGVHGGTVEVDSVVGQGTTFTIRIALGHRKKTRHSIEPVLAHH